MAHTTTDPIAPGEHDLAVLETAREVVARGWVQHEWYRTPPRTLRDRLFGPMPGPDGLEAACLVAAVVVAGHAGGVFTHVDRDSGPALDRLWEAWQESRGRPGTPAGAVAPVVRRARLRELVRWNDAAGRTRDEVLGLLDRAISRTILEQVNGVGARGDRPRSGRHPGPGTDGSAAPQHSTRHVVGSSTT